jgi:hypothetical protein
MSEQRDFLVGMVEACFLPDGTLEPRFEPDLVAWLEVAKREKYDAEEIYREAVGNLVRWQGAPKYEEVAPR